MGSIYQDLATTPARGLEGRDSITQTQKPEQADPQPQLLSLFPSA